MAASGEEAAAEASRATAALPKAALRGDLAAVSALLAARADPNVPTAESGSTALHRAAARGHEAVVAALLEARASVLLRDETFNGTALDVAKAKHEGPKACGLIKLLEAAAAGERTGREQHTVAEVAADSSLKHMVALTAAYGAADIGQTGDYTDGHTAVGETDALTALASGASLLYGELLPASASRLWRALGLAEDGSEAAREDERRREPAATVLELGMGTGKVALQAFIECSTTVKRVLGVELAPSRYLIGEQALLRLAEAMPSRFEVALLESGKRIILRERSSAEGSTARTLRELEFRQGDLLKVPLEDMQAADSVIMEVCLPVSLHPAVCEKTRELRPGVRIFSLADLPLLWPEDLDGAPCHLQHCSGADGSSYDTKYYTSWTRDQRSADEGHPFFLMQTSAVGSELKVLDACDIATREARARARMASNPSNKQFDEDERCDGVVEFLGLESTRTEGGRDLGFLVPGAPVEVAQRYYVEGAAVRWHPAWILRVHGDREQVDVVFARRGDLEEFCPFFRIRPLPEAKAISQAGAA